MIFDFINYIIFGGLAALGFGVLFNVPKRTLWLVFLGGSIAVSFRNSLQHHLNWSIEVTSFIGAFMAGIWTIIWVHRVHTPAAVIGVASIIPLVPGVFLYKSLIGFIGYNTFQAAENNHMLDDALGYAIRSLSILFGIAIGLSIPVIWERKIYERKRRRRIKASLKAAAK